MTEQFWSVSYIDWMDHELTTVVVQADSWHKALVMHPKCSPVDGFIYSDVSLEQAKNDAFNGDSMIEVVNLCDALAPTHRITKT